MPDENMTQRIDEWGDPPETNQTEARVGLAIIAFFFACGLLFDHFFIVGYLHM